MRFMHEDDVAMYHERALRTLSIQQRLQIGAAARRPHDAPVEGAV